MIKHDSDKTDGIKRMSQLQLAFPRGVILIQLQKANGGGQVFRNFPIIILPKTVVIYRDKLARQVFVNWQPPTILDNGNCRGR